MASAASATSSAAAAPDDPGRRAYALCERLYPICRSLTGDGVRETLALVGETVPLEVREVPSGTRVLDWTVPDEWNIRDAWVRGPGGGRVVDFRQSNLHVMGYSVPVRRTMPLAELREHVHTLPEHPDWIPYRTSYYQRRWGICMSHNALESLPEGEYEVCIDSTLEPGTMTWGECVVPGETEDEVVIATHVCHPSMANDNTSSLAVAALLAEHVASRPRRHTYRFLFLPGTIGTIAWLALNEERTDRIAAGLVLAGTGDPGSPTYKRSRRGNAHVDRALEHLLGRRNDDCEVQDFSPYGYDERQWCSPGFDLPVGCLMRTPWGRYPQYHTSADDLSLIRPESLADTLGLLIDVVDVLERDRPWVNTSPKGEPQLGRRGLYGSLGGASGTEDLTMALLWVLNLSDGDHGLLDVAERSGLPFATVAEAARLLEDSGLLVEP